MRCGQNFIHFNSLSAEEKEKETFSSRERELRKMEKVGETCLAAEDGVWSSVNNSFLYFLSTGRDKHTF